MGKKPFYIILGVAALMVLAGVLLPLFISSDAVRKSLIQRAHEITGREMKFSGTPKVLFQPFLGIEINDVVFTGQFGEQGSAPILVMPELKAKLSLLSALTGNVELTSFHFVRPKFNLKIFSTGQSSWQFPEGKMWNILTAARQLRENIDPGEVADLGLIPEISFGGVTIQDGVIEFEDEILGSTETVTSLNGTFNWQSTRSAWTFNGNGIWRGDAMQFQTRAETPILLLAGGQSDIQVTVRSEPMDLDFSGTANRLSDLFFNGNLNINTPSLRRFANFFGAGLPAGSTFGQFSSVGDISGTFSEFEMGETEITLDGNSAAGSLKFSSTEDSSNRLTGTLAFADFDLDPYLNLTQTQVGEEIPATQELSSLSTLEMDLRVSTPALSSSVFEILNFAGGLKSKDGVLSLNIGNAEVADGILVGDVSISAEEEKLSIRSDLNFSNVDISEFKAITKLGNIQPIGLGEINVKLQSEGVNVSELARNVTGETSFNLKSGEILGLNLQGVKDASEQGIIDRANLNIDLDTSTQFSGLEVSAVVNRGVGWITRGMLVSENFRSHIAGKIDLHLGTLALRGQFIEENEEEPAKPIQLKKYFIGGTVKQPLYVLE